MNKILGLLACMFVAGCATTTKPEAPVAKPVAPAAAVIVVDTSWVDNAISIFTEELKARPNQPGIYYNRAVAYFYKKQYDLSWRDLRKAQVLGASVDLVFLRKLKAASGKK
jgi:tetratricopeptide (TPR) repeat protein